MRGVIKKKLADKLTIITNIQGVSLSKSELSILAEIVYYSNNGSVTLDMTLTKQIRDKLNISPSLFSTAIHRLMEKKVIRKAGKTIVISPVYTSLESITELLIKFE